MVSSLGTCSRIQNSLNLYLQSKSKQGCVTPDVKGGDSNTKRMAEINVTTSRHFRALGCPSFKPPWTREQLRLFFGPEAAESKAEIYGPDATDSGASTPQKLTKAELAEHSANIRSFWRGGRQARGHRVETSAEPSSPSMLTGEPGTTVDPAAAGTRSRHDATLQRTPYKEKLLNKKSQLRDRIQQKHSAIASISAAEFGIVESLPAARNVTRHPEYEVEQKRAYRFELEAQARAKKARTAVMQRRHELLAKRSLEHQEALHERRTRSEEHRALRARHVQKASWDMQIVKKQAARAAKQAHEQKVQQQLTLLRNNMKTQLSHAERRAEARHLANYHAKLSAWQAAHN